jgi:hypothetical protein
MAMVLPTFSSAFSRCFEPIPPVKTSDLDLMLVQKVTSAQLRCMVGLAKTLFRLTMNLRPPTA